MSSPSVSSVHSSTNIIPQDTVAAAAERRVRQTVPQKTAAQLAAEHERRQKFRRMVDPGITRPNAHEQAMRSLRILLTISGNLITDPNNEKYQRFKPTNSIIKRDLMDPKGTVEYAREMGFHPQVIDFQPFYIFNSKFMEDLKIGNEILKDYLALIDEKESRAAIAKKNEKAAKEAAAERVKLAFMDDRKIKLMRDEMERENREGRAARQAQEALAAANRQSPPPPELPMPGSGHLLSGDLEDIDPPEYEINHENKSD
ncbi:hypothetical protein CPB83DRAFT_889289 [Crepidotus variabilis]|uniref:PUB domain-containing protein n=1 Tax=Crepidotus variabilis TaxID=179855 RepID=A0A9P6JVW1_9AGAR|nr:hypothetical protein CPB83DRAFT_889289 [Crepidotus variabilis]